MMFKIELQLKNGYPIQHDIVSATVIAEKCIDADAIATAIMVKGYDAGMNWINSIENVEALIVIKKSNEELIMKSSNGFRAF